MDKKNDSKKSVNDATLTKIGDIYQYLIALRDCFELNDGEILQIEIGGDVSVINESGGIFQKEVKHHLSVNNLSDRDIDFWKTLSNWYVEYERIKSFKSCILYTTSKITDTSSFYNWNSLDKEEKLKRIKAIGATKKDKEEGFRIQYSRIFNDSYDEKRLLGILEKFEILEAQTTIVGISSSFSKYIGHIPLENRDRYIGALLGEILIGVKNPPHKWEITRADFEKIIQSQSAAYVDASKTPLPKEFSKISLPEDKVGLLEQKKFVSAIREIQYDSMIHSAMEDYWKADMTVARYFRDDLMYLQSLEDYRNDLSSKMHYAKADSEIDAEGATTEEKIKISKKLYNATMRWDANDFGSIISNQSFFQRGIIHNIVDETDYTWKVGEKDEH